MSSMDWQCWMCDKCGSPLFVCGKAVLVWWYFKGTTCPSGAHVLGGFLWAHKHLLEALDRNKLLKCVFLSWCCLGGWLLWGTQLRFVPPGSAHGAQLSRRVWCSLLMSLNLDGTKVCDSTWGCLEPRDVNLLTKMVHVQKYSMTQSPDFFSSPHAKILPLLRTFISNSETPKRQ